MGKIYHSIDSLGRATIASNSDDRVNANDLDRHLPYLNSKLTPNNKLVCPFIQVHVPCSSPVLTRLWIYIPEYFKPQTATIKIIDRDSLDLEIHPQVISAVISFQGQWLQIKFDRPIFPDTNLQIDFNPMDMNMYVKLPEYFMYSKSVDGQSSFIGRGYFGRME